MEGILNPIRDGKYCWYQMVVCLARLKLTINSPWETISGFKSSGFDKGTGRKSGKFQFDCGGCILFTRRSINITNSLSFSFYNLPFFCTVFFTAELSIMLQRLILLHRSLRFNNRNSIIDCNFGNTWRVFGVKIIE